MTTWTNALLSPPPPHVLQLLGSRERQPGEVAHRFVNGFDDPRDYFEWFMDPESAERYLADVSA